MIHAVLGTGHCPEKALVEALTDALNEGDELVLPWVYPVPQALETVYKFILDQEVPFTLVYSDAASKPPTRHFRESTHGVVEKNRDPIGACLKHCDDSVLYLWDDDGALVEHIFDTLPSVVMLELSNGLAPIIIESDDPAPAPAPAPAQDDMDTTFTKEELEVMSLSLVKRYGERMGCEATTKSGIIEELFPSDVPATVDVPVRTYDSPFAPPPSSKPFIVVALFPDKDWKMATGTDGPITVYPDGTVVCG